MTYEMDIILKLDKQLIWKFQWKNNPIQINSENNDIHSYLS